MSDRPSSTRHRLTPVVPWPSVGSLDAHIRAEQVRLVFQQAPAAQLLTLVAAALIAYALWDVGDRARLGVWFAAVTAITLVRLTLSLQFHRRTPAAEHMPWWEQAFIVSLAAICLAWGAGGWWIMPHGSLLHQALVYFFLMGIAGGAVATYAAHAVASAMAICALMLPATVGFALENVLELRVLALGGLLYLFAALRSTRNFAYFLHQTFQLSHALHLAYERAKEQSRTDELTGLANRRAFLEQGTAALDQALRYGRPLSLVMCDIDHFKPINDTHGHAAGDAVLRAVSERLRRAARAADISGRLGGEEFALLLPETTADAAVILAERLRRDVGAQAVLYDGVVLRFTCSFGVAQHSPAMERLGMLLGAADKALYRAKSLGRDRVEQHE
ncbi:MAG TPA: GGDEF domain-containing protein [Gemmatimonadales bacterium]|nr:GGDEF domain-containing protein [Gemmatimonadales bacterium]